MRIVSLIWWIEVDIFEGNISDSYEQPLSDGIRFLWPTRSLLWTQRKVQCSTAFLMIELNGMRKLSSIIKLNGANMFTVQTKTKIHSYDIFYAAYDICYFSYMIYHMHKIHSPHCTQPTSVDFLLKLEV